MAARGCRVGKVFANILNDSRAAIRTAAHKPKYLYTLSSSGRLSQVLVKRKGDYCENLWGRLLQNCRLTNACLQSLFFSGTFLKPLQATTVNNNCGFHTSGRSCLFSEMLIVN